MQKSTCAASPIQISSVGSDIFVSQDLQRISNLDSEKRTSNPLALMAVSRRIAKTRPVQMPYSNVLVNNKPNFHPIPTFSTTSMT
jgi:hypothetical protein